MRTLTVRRSPAPLALATTLLVAFVLFFAWPQSASAHDSLVGSDPAADSTIEALPPELTLTFSAALIDGEGATEVVVMDADCKDVADGAPTLDGAMVTQPLTSDAAIGEYHVTWKVVSSDGHPTSGEFGFTVASSGADATSPDASAAATPAAEATPSTACDSAAAQSPEEGTPADGDAFLRVLPWILGALVVAGGGGALVAVLVARQRRGASASDSDGDASDSDEPAER